MLLANWLYWGLVLVGIAGIGAGLFLLVSVGAVDLWSLFAGLCLGYRVWLRFFLFRGSSVLHTLKI